ncbi:transposase [Streptomyces sp. NPDC050732]|uniref:transposase n=1 Tax=Streptomyces sp. NPDC050732 TaxID=3154632 RepID=UPI0034464365
MQPCWTWLPTASASTSYLSGSGTSPARSYWTTPRPTRPTRSRAVAVSWRKIGVELCSLPPYGPELNDIELVWRQAKHEGYPQRTQTRDRLPRQSRRPGHDPATRPNPRIGKQHRAQAA